MRTRRWILVLALFFSFTALVIYHGWNIFSVNEKIRKYVLVKIEPALGADFQIKKLDISLGAIHLKNVAVNDEDFLLQIEDVRIGFNFTNLVKNSFRPQKIPHDILFIKPYLILRPGLITMLKNSTADSAEIVKDVPPRQYWEKLKGFDFIKRVTISKGKICYQDSANYSDLILANDINGWFSSNDEQTITIRLVGKLFQSGAYNLYIDGNVDVSQRNFDLLDIKIKNYSWSQKNRLFLPDYFDIRQGVINGAITATRNKTKLNGLDILGEISIGDGAIQIPDKQLYFEKINLKAKIEGQNCIIENSGFIFNGSSIDVTGTIQDIPYPRLDLTLKCDHFDVLKSLKYLAPKSSINLAGISTLSLHISNSVSNPTVIGQLLSPRVAIRDKILEHVKVDVVLADSVFQIKDFSGQLEALELTGYALVDFARSPDSLVFSITSNGKFFPTLIKFPLPSLEDANCNLQLSGKGNLSRVSGTIDLNLKSKAQPETDYNFIGDFGVQNDKLSIRLNSPSHHCWAEGQIMLSNIQPRYQFRLSDIHRLLHSLPELRAIKPLLNYKAAMIQIQSDHSKWMVNGKYVWNEPAQRTINMKCRIESQHNQQRIDTDFDIHSAHKNFISRLNLIKTPAYWDIIHFDIENIVYSNGRIYSNPEKRVEANIIVADASLPDLGRLLLSDAQSIDQGKLYGFIGINGSLANPQITGNLDFSGIMLNRVGFYDGSLMFQLINKKLVLNKFKIDFNNQSLFRCNGWYSLDKDQLNFDVLGQDIDMNSVMATLFNKPGLMEGMGSSWLQLNGSLNRPKVYGKIDIENGKLGPFPFNQFKLNFGEKSGAELSTGSFDADSLAEQGIRLENIMINRLGQFAIQGQGIIPYSSQQPMSIQLKGEGNIFSLLPDLTPFFKETRSKAEWQVNFAGSPSNIIISESKLQLSDGYLRLGDVANEIKNITAEMELEQDGFLNVKVISGKIRERPFAFRNFRSDANLSLETFSIPELGLDLGIFELETSPKGIPLHIPGLMKKREIGHFVFLGKNANEKFYFAGPIEQPKVRGKIQLHNGNITFPFITNNSADTARSSPVVEVLTHINWDVTAEAGKDLHYQREFPGGVDNAYLDLIVNAGIGSLEFKGVISDSSFGVSGSLESSHGTVEYQDLNFEIIKAGVEFDSDISPESEVVFDKNSLLPIVYGEARTTVTDSTGYPYYIYLTLLTVDEETGHALKRGRLGELKFHLSADNPNLGMGYTEGELLASLGYSSSNIPKMATALIGISADNLLFRPLFRPFERQLERTFGLDVVRFSSRFTRNLIEMNLADDRTFQLDYRLFLLRSTKVMLGKYLAERLFLLYTGQLEAGMGYRYQQEGFGFHHTLGLEFRVNPSLLLQMQYDYDSLLLWQKEDKRIMVRHSFPF